VSRFYDAHLLATAPALLPAIEEGETVLGVAVEAL
jgi:hypothetical protein